MTFYNKVKTTAADYAAMIATPCENSPIQPYPDSTLAPTATSQFLARYHYLWGQQGEGVGVNIGPNALVTGLMSKLCMASFNGGNPFPIDGSGTALRYPGTILKPTNLTYNLQASFWNPALTGGGNWMSDYGNPQAVVGALATVDRTLAYGIKVKYAGLPNGALFPGGRVYALAVQQNEIFPFLGQAGCAVGSTPGTLNENFLLQSVQMGKGISFSVAELAARTEGITFYGLPQGPNSFVFSNVNDGYVQAGVIPGTIASSTTTTAAYGTVAANPMLLIFICQPGVGIPASDQQGAQFEFTYGHKIEYIPTATAASLVSTMSAVPDAGVVDGINKVVGALSGAISGKTSLTDIGNLLNGSLKTASKIFNGFGAMGGLNGGAAGAWSTVTAIEEIAPLAQIAGGAGPLLLTL